MSSRDRNQAAHPYTGAVELRVPEGISASERSLRQELARRHGRYEVDVAKSVDSTEEKG
jgi:hypothetical protein